jgi:hypothetical protein
MSAVIKIDIKELGRELRARGRAVQRAIEKGMVVGAARGRTHLVELSDEHGITDRGLYKNAWKRHSRGRGRVDLHNQAPYAGIIEVGARPHPVSNEGLFAIAAWVERKPGDRVQSVASQRAYATQGPLPKGTSRRSFEAGIRRHERRQVAYDIAVAIARKIAARGQEPKWVVRNALPELTRMLQVECERLIREQAGRRAGRGEGA